MAVFEDRPDYDEPHALRAARAAWGMQRALDDVQPRARKAAGHAHRAELRTIVRGDIGSRFVRRDYTCIGDVVNRAQRHESKCPLGGVLFSADLYARIEGAREVEEMTRPRAEGHRPARQRATCSRVSKRHMRCVRRNIVAVAGATLALGLVAAGGAAWRTTRPTRPAIRTTRSAPGGASPTARACCCAASRRTRRARCSRTAGLRRSRAPRRRRRARPARPQPPDAGTPDAQQPVPSVQHVEATVGPVVVDEGALPQGGEQTGRARKRYEECVEKHGGLDQRPRPGRRALPGARDARARRGRYGEETQRRRREGSALRRRRGRSPLRGCSRRAARGGHAGGQVQYKCSR